MGIILGGSASRSRDFSQRTGGRMGIGKGCSWVAMMMMMNIGAYKQLSIDVAVVQVTQNTMTQFQGELGR